MKYLKTFICLFIVTNLSGQTFTNYTTADGLVDNNVSCGTFEGNGVMWFGTQNGISKFLNIPNSDFCKGLIEIILKILNENLFDKLKNIGQQITELHLNNNREANQTIESLNNTIKRLTDALNSEKRINEEKNKEKSELYVTKIELESKYEKLFRDSKSKDREFSNNLAIEIQKFQKMELAKDYK